jgi:hypothetical protein
VISSGRRLRRAVAAVASLAILALDPAFAEDAAPPGPPSAIEGAEDLEPEEAPPSPWVEYGSKAFDVFPIRVLSACAVVVGFGAFVVSVPLVAPGGQMEAIRSSWDYFVVGPVEYTVVRPLGDF